MTPRHEANLAAMELRRNGVQLKEISRRMREQYGVNLSPQGWSRCLTRRNVTIDRATLDSAARALRDEGCSWEAISLLMFERFGCRRGASAWRYRVLGYERVGASV